MSEFAVPRDNKELYVRYATAVARLVRKYDVVGRHYDDMLQAIWLRLLEADILGKYDTSLDRIPDVITGLQASQHLSVTPEQWRVAMWRTNVGIHSWAPVPLTGNRVQKTAMFRRVEVEAVAHHFYKKHEDIKLVAFRQTSSRGKFESYLTMAVKNTYKNFCRTLSRKDRDLYFPPDEQGNAWESKVACCGASPDDLAELHMLVGGAGDHAGDVVDLLDDGYSMAEVVSKMGRQVRVVQQTKFVRRA